MSTLFAVATRAYSGLKPVRDLKRLAFCRKHPCIVSGCRRYAEAAHTGPHGLGQKSDDNQSLPLCPWHHKLSPVSLHRLGPVEFQRRNNLDFANLILELNESYALEVKP